MIEEIKSEDVSKASRYIQNHCITSFRVNVRSVAPDAIGVTAKLLFPEEVYFNFIYANYCPCHHDGGN